MKLKTLRTAVQRWRKSKYSPPLAAGTTKWGFQRGRASPLVTCGVNTPYAKCLVYWIAVIVIAGLTSLTACVVYEPVPAPAPSTFDRSWSAALAAAQDEGVRIASEDRGSGVIRGYRDEQEITINVRTQADGSVRVEMSAAGAQRIGPRISR